MSSPTSDRSQQVSSLISNLHQVTESLNDLRGATGDVAGLRFSSIVALAQEMTDSVNALAMLYAARGVTGDAAGSSISLVLAMAQQVNISMIELERVHAARGNTGEATAPFVITETGIAETVILDAPPEVMTALDHGGSMYATGPGVSSTPFIVSIPCALMLTHPAHECQFIGFAFANIV